MTARPAGSAMAGRGRRIGSCSEGVAVTYAAAPSPIGRGRRREWPGHWRSGPSPGPEPSQRPWRWARGWPARRRPRVLALSLRARSRRRRRLRASRGATSSPGCTGGTSAAATTAEAAGPWQRQRGGNGPGGPPTTVTPAPTTPTTAPPVTVSPGVPVATLPPATPPPATPAPTTVPPATQPPATAGRRARGCRRAGAVDGRSHHTDQPHHRRAAHGGHHRGHGPVDPGHADRRPGRGRGPRAARCRCAAGRRARAPPLRIVRSSARSSTRRPVRSAGVSSRWPGSSSPWQSGSWLPPSTTGRSWCGASRSVATSTSTERR